MTIVNSFAVFITMHEICELTKVRESTKRTANYLEFYARAPLATMVC